jgi:hypothetical protein
MKRLLLALSAAIILLFSSCILSQSEHWIAVQVCQNDNPLKANNDAVKASINYPIVGHCFLIPFCDNDIKLSKIEYDTDYLEFLSFDNNNLYFKPLKAGTTKFKVYTDNYGNAASLKIIIE